MRETTKHVGWPGGSKDRGHSTQRLQTSPSLLEWGAAPGGAQQGRRHGDATVSPPGLGAAQRTHISSQVHAGPRGPQDGALCFQKRSPNFKSSKVLLISKNRSLLV